MTKSITFRKSDNRELIINFLRENPVMYEGLLIQAKKWENEGKMTYQTFRRWYNKLRDRGVIIEPPLRLAEEYVEANRLEVAGLIQDKFQAQNVILLQGRLTQLENISGTQKIAHIPGVMLALKESLKNPLIIDNNTIFDLIIRTIINVFSSELKFPMEISRKIIEEISNHFIPIINTIIRKKTGFPSGWILHLFSLCGNSETVNILFEKMYAYADLDSRERSNISLGYYLGPTTKLYQTHYSIINEHLDNLAKSGNSKLQAVSLELRQAIAQAYPFKM